MSLLPVAEAQARLLALAPAPATERVPLDGCAGRWLTEDVDALRDQPAADLSAMDGYALRHADLPGPFTVAGESAAGAASLPPLGSQQAMRIFTGAPLPPGADSVLIQEDAEREGDRLSARAGTDVRRHAHVRHQGSDFHHGRRLMEKGTRLGPAQLGLAAIAGHGMLPVGKRPRIALLSTGDELVPAGGAVGPGKLPSSNAVMLRALLAELPCEVDDLGIVPDALPQLTAAFRRAADADILVTTGGASVGDHDLVKPALEAAGGRLDFWKIRMRPGKPLIAGRIGDALFLGLPGNPVSAFVTAILFLLPLVRHRAGSSSPKPRNMQAPLGVDLGPGGQRDDYLRARFTQDMVIPEEDQGSANMLSLSRANCLLLRPALSPARPKGAQVTIIPI